MGRIARRHIALLFAIAAAGCVYTSGPVGRSPVSLSPKEWEGLWIMEMHGIEKSDRRDPVPVVIKVLDEKQGVLQAWAMGEDGAQYSAHAMTVFVRSCAGTHFVSWPERPDSDTYFWAVLGRSAGTMVLYLPDPNQFGAAVENGALTGALAPGGDVWLGHMSGEQLGLVAGSEALFLREPIVVLTRWESRRGPAVLPPAFKEETKRSREAPSPVAPPGGGGDR